MQLTGYDIALISGGFTMVGVLVGSILTYRFALKLAASNSRREAGRRLREAFAPELAAMTLVKLDNNFEVEKLLKSAFPKHLTAVVEFAFYLPPGERALFEKAWRTYYEVGGSVEFMNYMFGDNRRQLFVERVNTILRFTEV